MIDKKSRIPLYAQLIDIILHKINSGELKEHDKLPSERELCDQFDISRTTIRQAMIELEKEGYIYKEHGKGSFVSPTTFTQSLVKMYSFTEEMEKLGKHPRAVMINFAIKQVFGKATAILLLDEGEEVFEMSRLRLVDEEPIIFETSYLPVKYFPNLSENDFKEKAMYQLFLSKYNYRISKAKENFRAVNMSEEEAAYLHEKVGSAALRIERVAFSDGRAIEYTFSVARGNKYEYTTELNL
ncbi:GntR family transcriptional regulator [Neobacillus sp. LXY-1]|uniref:GntR family transcriptional regulator n=1 Tax=Neobacillus sp. LXY-1 TaxID=3379133 RepID=UPI003EE0CA89